MALDYSVRYPSQIDTSDPTGYPQGAAQNIAVPGDGTGTPWEADLVNDIFGLLQSLLSAGGVSPNGVPDKVGTSDYLDALQVLIRANTTITPSQITGDVNDYGPTGHSTALIERWSSDAARSVKGFDSTALVKRKIIVNVGSFTITLPHLSTGQSAGNRWSCPDSVNFALKAGEIVLVVHDTTSAVWRVVFRSILTHANTWSATQTFATVVATGNVGAVQLTSTTDVLADGDITADFAVTAGTDVTAGGDFLYSSPPTRTKLIPLGAGNAGWVRENTATGHKLEADPPNSVFIKFDLSEHIPHGCTLTRVRVGITQSASPVTPMSLDVYRYTVDTGTGGASGFSNLGTDTGDGSGDDILSVSPAESFSSSAEYLVAVVTASDNVGGSDEDFINWVEVQFTDPGPRNN